MPERQQRRAGDAEPRGCLEIETQRQTMRAETVVMVLHRAAILIVMIFLRSLARLMVSTTGLDRLAAPAGGTAVHGENAGIQAGENAENPQRCEKESHQWPQTRRHFAKTQGKILAREPGKSTARVPRSSALPLALPGASFRPECLTSRLKWNPPAANGWASGA